MPIMQIVFQKTILILTLEQYPNKADVVRIKINSFIFIDMLKKTIPNHPSKEGN
jgi:hypothetical protein